MLLIRSRWPWSTGEKARAEEQPAAYVVLVSGIGVLALVAGVIALVAGSAAMLAALAALMGGLWGDRDGQAHAGIEGSRERFPRPAKTA